MGSSGDRLCQTSPIPRSPDGDNNCIADLVAGGGCIMPVVINSSPPG